MKTLKDFFGPKGEGGQAIVLLAISMMAMLFVVGLAVDAGQLFVAKRTMQEAADAAAFAGAVVLYQGGTQAQATAAATADATRNGFTNSANVVVTVASPPTTGAFAGNNRYVQVTIVEQVRTTLVPAEAAFNPVHSRGVAGADPIHSPFAIVALKQTGPCIALGGTGNINVDTAGTNGGMIQANCTGTSITFGGSGKITDADGTRTVGTASSSGVLPANSLSQNASKQPDPFALFPKPTTAGLPTFGPGFTVPASACNVATPLTPGIYTGGITNNQNCNVYLGNGPFILKGGGFNQNSSSGVITTVPLGAMLFNTNSSYPAAGGTCGSIQAQSGGGFNLYPMTVGTYAGMALYQDAACAAQMIAIQSNGAYDIHGTLYAPTAVLDLQSQSSMTMHAQIVVSSINFQSSGDLNVIYDPDGSALSGLPTLVE
ncbi:MAG: pilus assembly protein TadG-related protein [Chloroflexota bacterium]|nr:pilus assembly protein TadG-related protein [Chloroflexota bacterium]